MLTQCPGYHLLLLFITSNNFYDHQHPYCLLERREYSKQNKYFDDLFREICYIRQVSVSVNFMNLSMCKVSVVAERTTNHVCYCIEMYHFINGGITITNLNVNSLYVYVRAKNE